MGYCFAVVGDDVLNPFRRQLESASSVMSRPRLRVKRVTSQRSQQST